MGYPHTIGLTSALATITKNWHGPLNDLSGRARSRLPLLAFAATAVAISACSHPDRGAPVPVDLTTQAIVDGIPNARFWPDEAPDEMVDLVLHMVDRERAQLAASGLEPGQALPPVHLLAISGGGEDGAFGAGLLVGWSETGTRPEFKLVTGVSTGALTAPFAFLGPDYDDALEAVYTEISAADIFQERGLLAAVFDDALSDTTPLRDTIARYANEEMFAAIATEYEKGRVLFIGTTDIDARRPVIWNIGAIASSGAPGAIDLFHDILVASAAVPGAFPPVMIDVAAEGQTYQEMHVDGGAISQVFVYPPSLDTERLRSEGIRRDRSLYVIRNARLDADWAETERRTLDIVSRAISSLIQSQGVGDLYRIYLTSRRDQIEFNLAYIGSDFDVTLEEPFDQHYMRALFEYGYEQGRAGFSWVDTPPGFHALASQ